MPLIPAFHEIRFPTNIAFGSSGGPERRTEVVTLGSGSERRNARWAESRRRYDAGYGVRSLADLHQVIAFFEERRGKLFGFRWRDRADDASAPPGTEPAPTDQALGVGDGETVVFALKKTYGVLHAPYERAIAKPVAGSVRIAIDGVSTEDFVVDPATGLVTLGEAPAEGGIVTAGFRFDVPVRFDADQLVINLAAFEAGEIPSIPIVEIRP
ncbi:phage distal tail protein, Rcc01695 family [Kaistia sp. MMO-174]|uniref:phage distal tail protein, Rcc01695 family n=1 Tax=Kaistia sp. MMO-174 TaxID=3081256 RepID=UPI003FA57F19